MLRLQGTQNQAEMRMWEGCMPAKSWEEHLFLSAHEPHGLERQETQEKTIHRVALGGCVEDWVILGTG